MTDKALEAALKAADPLLFSDDEPTAHMAASPVRVDVAKDLVRSRIKAAISAYLSALPGDAEVVGYLNWSEINQRRYFADIPRGQRDAWPLVTLTSLQAMQARAEAAERERDEWREALKPSGETKAEYIGEFQFTVTMMELDESDEPYECQRMVTVPWTTIKEIMAAISERAARTALTGGSNG